VEARTTLTDVNDAFWEASEDEACRSAMAMVLMIICGLVKTVIDYCL
jgi:hypothetical protein